MSNSNFEIKVVYDGKGNAEITSKILNPSLGVIRGDVENQVHGFVNFAKIPQKETFISGDLKEMIVKYLKEKFPEVKILN